MSLAEIKSSLLRLTGKDSKQSILNMSRAEGLHEPLLPPFHLLTPKNRGPLVLVTGVILVVITTLTVAVKLWTRYATTRSLALNDATIIAAAV